ncbi:MAG: sarcosine oxidase subunit gamma family protein [Pseudorhodoplanes sp.]
MSELSEWRATGAWDGVAIPGRLGITGEAGITVTPRHDLALAYVIASERDQASSAELLSDRFGIELPVKPKAIGRGDLTMVWSGPSQWLAVSEKAALARRLVDALGRRMAITDQSAARAVLVLEGARVRDLLAKGCPVDLHPRSFLRGDAAVTIIAGIGAQLWQADGSDALYIVVARSMAGSFWSWLTHSAGEFGVEVRAAVEA